MVLGFRSILCSMAVASSATNDEAGMLHIRKAQFIVQEDSTSNADPVFGELNSLSCGLGSPISSEDRCQEAASASGRNFRVLGVVARQLGKPKGCTYKSQKVFWNPHPTGRQRPRPRHGMVCEPPIATTTATTTAATGCGDVAFYSAGYIGGNQPHGGGWGSHGTISKEACFEKCKTWANGGCKAVDIQEVDGGVRCNIRSCDPTTDDSCRGDIVANSGWQIYSVPSRCCFEGPFEGKILAGWTSLGQKDPNCFQSVGMAKEKCLATPDCGGFSKQDWPANVDKGNLSHTTEGQFCIGYAMRRSSTLGTDHGANGISYTKCRGASAPCQPNHWVEYPGAWSSGGLGEGTSCFPLEEAKTLCHETANCNGLWWYSGHCNNSHAGAVPKYTLRDMIMPHPGPRYDSWMGGNEAVTKTLRYEC